MRIFIILSLAVGITGCGAKSSTRDNADAPIASVASVSNDASVTNDATDVPDESIAAVPNKPKGAELAGDFSRSKLIAADFVGTIAQIPATDPASIILHTDEPTTRFGELLLGTLQKAGFDLRVGSDSTDSWLAYNAIREEQLSDEGNPVYTFIIAAGEVKLKRSYEVDQYGVRPAGGMFVRGASTENVVVDDSLFNNRKDKTEPAIPTPEREPENELEETIIADATSNLDDSATAIADATPTIDDSKPTIADLNSDGASITPIPNTSVMKSNKVLSAEEKLRLDQRRELEESVAALAPLKDLAHADDFSNSDAYAEVSNIYETGHSRYQDIFKDYEVVDTSILVFPDDSLLLGRDNKKVIRRYATDFNKDTDVMSVIGCSHGKSKLVNGNAYLANGRAARVKEEFLSIGLAPKEVLEEGCWADVAYDKMPARGVLVQHKRLTEN